MLTPLLLLVAAQNGTEGPLRSDKLECDMARVRYEAIIKHWQQH